MEELTEGDAPWVRCNQDELGRRAAVQARARAALEQGANVVIDRTNMDTR